MSNPEFKSNKFKPAKFEQTLDSEPAKFKPLLDSEPEEERKDEFTDFIKNLKITKIRKYLFNITLINLNQVSYKNELICFVNLVHI